MFSNIQKSLFEAVRNNDIFALKEIMLLLKLHNGHWSDYNLKKSSDSALHIACREGHLDVVKFLCDVWNAVNSHIEDSNYQGKKCLHDAAQTCHWEVVEYLLEKGAKVDSLKAGDWTPLMMATTKTGFNALKTIKILLANGANPLLKNKDGWTSLHLASREGDENIVDILISSGVSTTIESYNGRTPLHIAALHGNQSIILKLLNENDNPLYCEDSCGCTPLSEAVRGQNKAVVELLVRRRAFVMAVDKLGLTCVHIAATVGCVDIMIFLIEKCCIPVDVVSHGTGLTPLHCAVRAGHLLCVKYLISMSANPLIADSKGRVAQDFCFHSSEVKNLITNYTKQYYECS